MRRTFRPSPVLLLLMGAWSVLLPETFAQEPSSRGAEPSPAQLFATGLVGDAALAVDSQGNLWVTNYRRPGTIGRISSVSGASLLWEVDHSEMTDAGTSALAGLALDDDQRVITLDASRGKLLRWNPQTDVSQVLADRHEGRRFDALFAVALDRQGNLYFSESQRVGSQGPSGSIYRFDVATNRTVRIMDGLAQPTGLCLSFEGDLLFYAESETGQIVSIDLQDEASDLPERELSLFSLLGLDDTESLGRIGHLTTDRRGWLYVALWDRGEVAVIDPLEGVLLKVIPSGGQQVVGLALRHDALLMSMPEREAVYCFDLRPLISRHAP